MQAELIEEITEEIKVDYEQYGEAELSSIAKRLASLEAEKERITGEISKYENRFLRGSQEFARTSRGIAEGITVNVYSKYYDGIAPEKIELIGQAIVGKCFARPESGKIQIVYALYQITENGEKSRLRFKPKLAAEWSAKNYPYFIKQA